ncbi:hypothetical protein Tco_1325498, partial [Tanacetum coccineum]
KVPKAILANPSPPYVLSSSQPLKGFVGLSVLTGKGVIRAGSGSGLTADSSVLTLTLSFLDFGLDFAQSFPFHAQFYGPLDPLGKDSPVRKECMNSFPLAFWFGHDGGWHVGWEILVGWDRGAR